MSKLFKCSLLACLIGLCLIACAHAADTALPSGAEPNAQIPEAIRQDVFIAEHLGSKISLDSTWFNEAGESRPLGDYFNHGRPIVLQMGYYQCPGLCDMVSQALIKSAQQVGLKAGTDYDLLFVSIDPTDTPSLAAMKRQHAIEAYGRADEADGFHFLVGRKAGIDVLAHETGFGYKLMPDGQLAHPAVIMLLTPDGKITRYLQPNNGVFDSETLRLSLVETSAGKIGTAMDEILLICFHFDAATGKYAWYAVHLMQAGGVVTVLVLGGSLFYLFRRESRLAASSGDEAGPNQDNK